MVCGILSESFDLRLCQLTVVGRIAYNHTWKFSIAVQLVLAGATDSNRLSADHEIDKATFYVG